MATQDTLLSEQSLFPHPDGAALSLQLPWYRSVWLSSITGLALEIDGAPIDAAKLRLEHRGESYRLDEIAEQSEVLWFLQDRPRLVAELDEPIADGSEHEVRLVADLRLPYMQIKPGSETEPGLYVPNHVDVTRTLVASEAVEAATTPYFEASAADALGEFAEPRDSDPFKLGLTLYSATAEFAAGWYDFDSLLARVAELGVGPGIEIVASQMVPTYPHVSDEFVAKWRSAFDKYGFDASSFGANLDMGRNRSRDMSLDEEFEFTETLLQSAKKLDFPLVRIQSAKPELLRRILPIAERLNLKLGYEIHAPLGPNAEPIVKVREVFEEFDSPLLGFVADFSSTMHSMAPTLLRSVKKRGLDDAAVEKLQEIWRTDVPMRERQQAFIAYLEGRGINPGILGSLAHLSFNMQGRVDVREWSDIMPQILHVHAKFYDIDEHGDEPAIDYRAITEEFVRGGFSGYMSSEWEGHAFADLGEVDPLVLVQRQHALIRRSMREVQALA